MTLHQSQLLTSQSSLAGFWRARYQQLQAHITEPRTRPRSSMQCKQPVFEAIKGTGFAQVSSSQPASSSA